MATEGVERLSGARSAMRSCDPGLGRRPFCEKFLERFENLNCLRDACGRMGAAGPVCESPGAAVGCAPVGPGSRRVHPFCDGSADGAADAPPWRHSSRRRRVRQRAPLPHCSGKCPIRLRNWERFVSWPSAKTVTRQATPPSERRSTQLPPNQARAGSEPTSRAFGITVKTTLRSWPSDRTGTPSWHPLHCPAAPVAVSRVSRDGASGIPRPPPALRSSFASDALLPGTATPGRTARWEALGIGEKLFYNIITAAREETHRRAVLTRMGAK